MDGESRFEAWVEFHRANPAVFEAFVSFARQARAAGAVKIGARMVGERIRWHSTVDARPTDGQYRFNDHLWPYYARLAMALYPELEGAFERRDQRFDATDQQILAAHAREVVGA